MNEKLKQNSPLGRSLTPENTKYLKQIPLEKQYTALKNARLIAAFAYRNVEWNPFQQEIINYSDSGRKQMKKLIDHRTGAPKGGCGSG